MRCRVKQDFTSLVNVILAVTRGNAIILKQGIQGIEWCYTKEPFVMTLSIDLINYCFITLHAQHIRIVQYQTPSLLCILEGHIWFLGCYFIWLLLHSPDVCELSFRLLRDNMRVC